MASSATPPVRETEIDDALDVLAEIDKVLTGTDETQSMDPIDSEALDLVHREYLNLSALAEGARRERVGTDPDPVKPPTRPLRVRSAPKQTPPQSPRTVYVLSSKQPEISPVDAEPERSAAEGEGWSGRIRDYPGILIAVFGLILTAGGLAISVAMGVGGWLYNEGEKRSASARADSMEVVRLDRQLSILDRESLSEERAHQVAELVVEGVRVLRASPPRAPAVNVNAITQISEPQASAVCAGTESFVSFPESWLVRGMCVPQEVLFELLERGLGHDVDSEGLDPPPSDLDGGADIGEEEDLGLPLANDGVRGPEVPDYEQQQRLGPHRRGVTLSRLYGLGRAGMK